MADKQPDISERDQLVTRPEGKLPSTADPKLPRGGPADPKVRPPDGQGNDPNAGELDYTA